mmetsp:Transcript_22140/g.55558  ORF Transcript_22140/g.55558 Transcript_22140/m.55558 type:complete len:601 (+) Transcript_22140:89-1891(+)
MVNAKKRAAMLKKAAQAKRDEEAKKVEDGAAPDSQDDAPAEEGDASSQFAAFKAAHRTAVGTLASRPDSRDIKIENITLTFHGRELLTGTAIELNYGNKYGLIGANGSGKSTILESIASRELPIPSHVDIYHLHREAEPTDMSALEIVVKEVEKEIQRLEAEADRILTEEGPDSMRLIEIQERIDEKDPHILETRAAEILHGLGFSKTRQALPTKDLSGGWRMRVALARALFVAPTLLLLDEPTNHLDIDACVWLENYLKHYKSTILMISHSQDFLNNVCTHTIHLTRAKLVYYGGNYDTFIKTKAENEVNQLKAYNKQQEDIAHIKKFIASAGTYANLVKQAKSKQKIIDKMEAAGLVEKPTEEAKFNFSFPPCGYLAPPVLAFEGVAFSYSGKKEDYLYKNLSFAVDLHSRIALVGPNGAGKSTLLKLMLGDLQPTEGLVNRHSHLTFGRYHQHSADIFDLNLSPLEFVKKMFNKVQQDDEMWRRDLGRYGLTGKMQVEPIGRMSDGLKSRLMFAIIAMQNPSILLLDEPTNHLDMECIDALARAINDFDGGLVLVSHDLRLISQVARDIWICDHKSVKPFKGDISEYKKVLGAQHKA